MEWPVGAEQYQHSLLEFQQWNPPSPSKDARGFLSLSTLHVLSSFESIAIFPLPLLVPLAHVEMFQDASQILKKTDM